MKLSLVAASSFLIVGSTSAFQTATKFGHTKTWTSTSALEAKAKAKAEKSISSGRGSGRGGGGVPFDRPSQALPFAKNGCPATLDGSLPGDAGFDPVGFSAAPFAEYFGRQTSAFSDTMDDLGWLREAELTHGRIAQLAVLGFLVPPVFGTFPGNEWTGLDAYSYVNPIEALDHVPDLAIAQIVAAMAWVELKRVSLISEQGKDRIPGDLLLGQGPGARVNPFGLNYTPQEFYEKQVQEIKHCRLAMLGAFGLFCQAANSGLDIKSQIGAALVYPEWYQKAGYFLPEGI